MMNKGKQFGNAHTHFQQSYSLPWCRTYLRIPDWLFLSIYCPGNFLLILNNIPQPGHIFPGKRGFLPYNKKYDPGAPDSHP